MQNWQKNDQLPVDEITSIQEQKLLELMEHVYYHSAYYRHAMDEEGLTPDKINGITDLKHLPFTTKEDLRANYPYQMAAVEMEDIVRIHASSGTTGKPVVMGYTEEDMAEWSQAVARACSIAGVTRRDIAQISFGYGLFTGGFGLHQGLEKLGAAVVPFSSGNTERQLKLMKDFQTSVLVSTPSFALYMAEAARDNNIDPASYNLHLGLFGGEPCSEPMRQEIEDQWQITATLNYGLTEVIGPGVSGECPQQQGMHLLEDCFIAEIIDPQTGAPLPAGETGELVLTPLIKKGFPVLRYRTGDITRIIPEPCSCGRTLRRMDYVTGRTDDMLIVKGVNIFPSQVEEILGDFKEVSPHYQLIVHRKKGFIKDLEIQVELTDAGFSDSFREMEHLEDRIRQHLRSSLSLAPKLKLMNPKSLERTTGKSRRIIEIEGDE